LFEKGRHLEACESPAASQRIAGIGALIAELGEAMLS
jgi:hypothetical protein